MLSTYDLNVPMNGHLQHRTEQLRRQVHCPLLRVAVLAVDNLTIA